MLAGGSCDTVATFGWFMGALCGLVIDVVLVVRVALAPRLREHAGQPQPVGFAERRLRLPPLLVIVIWSSGLCHLGVAALPCYVVHSALAATIMLSVFQLVIIATAANHIARRSIW